MKSYEVPGYRDNKTKREKETVLSCCDIEMPMSG